MPAKRLAAKPAAAGSGSSSSPVLLNLMMVGAAISFGMWLLISRGRVSWPPSELLANAYTVTGCLALIGPIVLLRRDAGEGGVGELLWMTGGVLIWLYDLIGFARGESRLDTLATPLGPRALGLTTLAIVAAAWRSRGASRSWSWKNISGWVIGVYWIGLGLATLLPGNPLRLSLF